MTPHGANPLKVLRTHVEPYQSLLREMVDFARRRAETNQEVIVKEALDDALRLVRHDRRGKHINLTTDVAPNLPPVNIRDDDLVLILVNLLINAFDAMPAGGTVTIEGTLNHAGEVLIRVTDTGMGMTDEVRTRATDALYTTKTEVPAGTLNLCRYPPSRRRSARACERAEPRHHCERLSSHHRGGGRPQFRARRRGRTGMTERILVIEDEETLRRNLVRYLTGLGYEVDEVACGTDAVPLLERHGYDIVLSDIVLGDMDGLDVLRHVRAVAPETAVLMMTAYGSLDSAIEAFRAGAGDYLLKPFPLEVLERESAT